jgi:hypothetical protein
MSTNLIWRSVFRRCLRIGENILEVQDKAGNNMGEHHGEAHERNHLEKSVSQHQVNDERHSCPLISRLSNLELPEG